jgi:hypothetical protein
MVCPLGYPFDSWDRRCSTSECGQALPVERVVACVPLRSIGVTLLLHYYEDIRLPIDRWASFQLSGCAALPLCRGIDGISRVPDFALVTCHGL